jgi:hypothetical protein
MSFSGALLRTLPVAVWLDIGPTLPPSDDLKIVLATDQEATRTS